MELATLHALYVEGLRDLYSAEQQILEALPKMMKAASHEDLVDAFDVQGVRESRRVLGDDRDRNRAFELLRRGDELERDRPELAMPMFCDDQDAHLAHSVPHVRVSRE